MDIERFERLVEAYGADPKRWPLVEREAARAFAHAKPEHCGPLLEAAHALDVTLDCAPAGAPSQALRELVLEAAPKPRRRLAENRWLWWPGAGLAAACAAGAVFGVVITEQATASSRADTILAANADLTVADAADVTESL